MLHRQFTIPILLIFALRGSAAMAYELYSPSRHWTSHSAELRTHSTTINTSALRATVEDWVKLWNAAPSDFSFSVIHGDTSVGTSNNQNEVWIASGDATTPPAETKVRYYAASGELVEADVIFYDDVSWSTLNGASYATLMGWNGSARSMVQAGIHELGHALGLAHEGDEYNTMGEEWTHMYTYCGRAYSYVGEDAADGAVAIYGLDSQPEEDVGVVSFKRTGMTSTGSYSVHGFVQMYDAAGAELPYTSLSDGTRRYTVQIGQQVQVEFTYENNGATTQTPKVEFLIGDSLCIGTDSSPFDSEVPTLGRNDVYTHKSNLTIPGGYADGDHYLGVVLDRANAIVEFNSRNNTSWIPIKIDGMISISVDKGRPVGL